MKFNLAFIGFGTVGQGLAKILVDKEELLKRKYNFEYNVVAVSDIKKGSVYNENGLNLKKLLQLVQQTGKIEDYEGGQKGLSSVEVIEKSNADIILEVTWTNLSLIHI